MAGASLSLPIDLRPLDKLEQQLKKERELAKQLNNELSEAKKNGKDTSDVVSRIKSNQGAISDLENKKATLGAQLRTEQRRNEIHAENLMTGNSQGLAKDVVLQAINKRFGTSALGQGLSSAVEGRNISTILETAAAGGGRLGAFAKAAGPVVGALAAAVVVGKVVGGAIDAAAKAISPADFDLKMSVAEGKLRMHNTADSNEKQLIRANIALEQSRFQQQRFSTVTFGLSDVVGTISDRIRKIDEASQARTETIRSISSIGTAGGSVANVGGPGGALGRVRQLAEVRMTDRERGKLSGAIGRGGAQLDRRLGIQSNEYEQKITNEQNKMIAEYQGKINDMWAAYERNDVYAARESYKQANDILEVPVKDQVWNNPKRNGYFALEGQRMSDAAYAFNQSVVPRVRLGY